LSAVWLSAVRRLGVGKAPFTLSVVRRLSVVSPPSAGRQSAVYRLVCPPTADAASADYRHCIRRLLADARLTGGNQLDHLAQIHVRAVGC